MNQSTERESTSNNDGAVNPIHYPSSSEINVPASLSCKSTSGLLENSESKSDMSSSSMSSSWSSEPSSPTATDKKSLSFQSSHDGESNKNDVENGSDGSPQANKHGSARLVIVNNNENGTMAQPAHIMDVNQFSKQRRKSWDLFQSVSGFYFNNIERHMYKPMNVTLWAFAMAWIYTMIPVNNYFVYCLVKNEYWVILVAISYNEIFSNNIPDVPDSLYILSYVVGILIAPIFHVVVWIYYMQNSFIFATLATIVSLAWAWFIFGIDCIRYPHSARQLRLQKKLERRLELGLSIIEAKDWGAMFAATGTYEVNMMPRVSNIQAPSVTSSMSSARSSTNSLFLSYQIAAGKKLVNVGPSDFTTVESGSGKSPQNKLDDDSEDSGKYSVDGSLSGKYSNDGGSRKYNRSQSVTVLKTQQDVIDWIDKVFSPKNFWFLPRYWDPHFGEKYGELPPNANRMHMWFAAGMFLTVYSSDYVFLIFFTQYFRKDSLSDYQRIILFGFYICVTTIFRIMLKSLGMYLDRYKNKSCSMFFVGEFLGLMFYYTFYRVLFESIRSVPEFLGLQLLHLVSEWVLYVFRATETYYNIAEGLGEKYFKCLLPQPRLPHKDWQQFIALDFGIRCTVFVATGYAVLLLVTTIEFIPYLGSTNALHVTLSNYQTTAIFIAVAVILEIINAYLINRFYFQKINLHVYEEVVHCFSLKHFALICGVLCSIMFINPVFAFTTVTFFH